jgi:hypothetical protein
MSKKGHDALVRAIILISSLSPQGLLFFFHPPPCSCFLDKQKTQQDNIQSQHSSGFRVSFFCRLGFYYMVLRVLHLQGGCYNALTLPTRGSTTQNSPSTSAPHSQYQNSLWTSVRFIFTNFASLFTVSTRTRKMQVDPELQLQDVII